MENRFAGAVNQGERRRRRLSNGEADDLLSVDEFQLQNVSEEPSAGATIQDSLLRRLISPRLWKPVATVLCVSMIVSLVIWHSRERATEFTSITPLTGLSDRLAGMFLLIAGQFAILIGWIRATSQVDFKGRYRSWKWMGVACGFVGTILLLQVGQLIPGLLSALVEPFTGPIEAARPAILFACAATFSVAVLARVIPDMGRCHSSQAMLVAGILTTLVRMMLVHGSSSQVTQATLEALTLIASNCIFASMLLHCRFVAYICNDPPVVSNQRSESRQDLKSTDSADELQAGSPDGREGNGHQRKAAAQPEASGRASETPAKPAKKKRRRSNRKAA